MNKYIASQNHLVAFEFTDSIAKSDVATCYSRLSVALAKYDVVSVYLDISAISDRSVRRFSRRLQTDFWRILNRYSVARLAIVCDDPAAAGLNGWQTWPEEQTEIAVFESHDQDMAIGWAGTLPAKDTPSTDVPSTYVPSAPTRLSEAAKAASAVNA